MKNGIRTRGSKLFIGAIALIIATGATFAGTLIPTVALAGADNNQLVSPVKNVGTSGNFVLTASSQLFVSPTGGGGGHYTPVSDPNFLQTAGTQSWQVASNWDSNPTVPNGVDVAVSFPSLTAAEEVDLNGAISVGSFTLTNDSTNVFTLRNGTSGPITFDVSSGTASLTINGTGNVVNTFGSSGTNLSMVLADTLVITINDTATTSATGALFNIDRGKWCGRYR